MKVRFPLPCINGESSPGGYCRRFRRIVSGSLPPLQCLWNLRPPPFAVARLCAVRVLAFKVKFFTAAAAAVSRFPSLLLFQSDFSQPIKGPAGLFGSLCKVHQRKTKLENKIEKLLLHQDGECHISFYSLVYSFIIILLSSPTTSTAPAIHTNSGREPDS